MHSLLKSFVVVSVVLSSLAVAQPQGEVVIRSRDGKTRMGRILSETSKGYLLAGPDGTEVVEFASIVDIRQLAPSAAAAPAPIPSAPVTPAPSVAKPGKQARQQPIAVAVAPPPPTPEPEPVAEIAPPPPPPERPTQPTVAEVMSDDAPEVKSPREGFHFGLGVGAFALPFGPMAQLQAHFEFNFGRPVYRLSANLGGMAMYTTGLATISVDNLFQFNVGDVYAFGAGLQVGLVLGNLGFFQASPVLQPVILKFGERGQHQVSLTASIALLSTTSGSVTFAGTPQVYLGYSFLF